MPKRQKMSKLEQIELAKKQMSGTGRYIFKNNTRGDLILPKKPNGSKTAVLMKGQTFEGDSYFFKMVPQELIFIGEAEMKKDILLTEQPPVVTHDGQVEFVRTSEEKPMNEDSKLPKKVLLTEPSGEGVTILK